MDDGHPRSIHKATTHLGLFKHHRPNTRGVGFLAYPWENKRHSLSRLCGLICREHSHALQVVFAWFFSPFDRKIRAAAHVFRRASHSPRPSPPPFISPFHPPSPKKEKKPSLIWLSRDGPCQRFTPRGAGDTQNFSGYINIKSRFPRTNGKCGCSEGLDVCRFSKRRVAAPGMARDYHTLQVYLFCRIYLYIPNLVG